MIEQIITSTILILLVFVVSKLLEKNLSPTLKYAIWLLVAVKLLVPVPEFESSMSVMRFVEQVEQDELRYIFINNEVENKEKQDELPSKIVAPQKNNLVIIEQVFKLCKIIWILGICLIGSIFLWSNLHFSFKLKKQQEYVGTYAGTLAIYETDNIWSPCLFGVFKPAIYLPKGISCLEEEKEMILAHEYTHYLHRDYFWSVIRCLCVVIYWFHPLVWLAAEQSRKDGELACDAGTLQRIGEEHNISYGKILLKLVERTRKEASSKRIFSCFTEFFGGKKEMKKRIQLLIQRPHTVVLSALLLISFCTIMVGCTFGKPETPKENLMITLSPTVTPTPTPTVIPMETPLPTQVSVTPKQEATQQVVYSSPIEDKVCIEIEPAEIREHVLYYYIPEEELQIELKEQMEVLELKWELSDRLWEKHKETGWAIRYQGEKWSVLDGKYLYRTYHDEEKGMMECLIEASKLCSTIQELLIKELNYQPIELSEIRDLVSVTLEMQGFRTEDIFYQKTITDKPLLQQFEDWFSGATYLYPGAECGKQQACLIFTREDGTVIRGCIATDSCTIFNLNGVDYDYRTKSYRKLGNTTSEYLFGCFDESLRMDREN